MYIGLDSYRVFYYVAQCRSFTGAANLLYSNQPNVTRTVKNLEQALGCQLFTRSTRSVRLTAEGEKLYTHIKIAMEQILSGEAEILRLRDLQGGTLSIGASEVALRCFLLPVLKQYRQRYPNVRLRVMNHTTPQAIAAIREGTADIAFVTMPGMKLPDLNVTAIRSFRETAVCGPAFAFLGKKPRSLNEIAGYPLISLSQETLTYRSYSQWFAENGLSFSPDVEAATADQILPLVQNNLGIGFVPEDFLEGSGDICRLELTSPMPERSICCLQKKGKPLSMAARALEALFLEDMEKEADSAPAGGAGQKG